VTDSCPFRGSNVSCGFLAIEVKYFMFGNYNISPLWGGNRKTQSSYGTDNYQSHLHTYEDGTDTVFRNVGL
jgi:hypothetical protein